MYPKSHLSISSFFLAFALVASACGSGYRLEAEVSIEKADALEEVPASLPFDDSSPSDSIADEDWARPYGRPIPSPGPNVDPFFPVVSRPPTTQGAAVVKTEEDEGVSKTAADPAVSEVTGSTTSTPPTDATSTSKPVTTKPPTTKPPTTKPVTTKPATTKPPTTKPPTTKPPTTQPPAGNSGSGPVGQSGAWKLIFSDEFNGNSIDTSKWERGWFADSGFSPPVNGFEDSCFHPKQLSQAGGQLEIQISRETSSECRKRDGSRADYVGGLINTRDQFTFSYGYAEARIHISAQGSRADNWPAFWHNGADWPRSGEVDILEGLGGDLCSYHHFADSRGQHGQNGSCVNWSNPGGWHVFAANWEPGRLTFYFDGKEVFTTTEGVVGDPHYLILNYTTNGDHGIVPNTSMLVDYVRVWQR